MAFEDSAVYLPPCPVLSAEGWRLRDVVQQSLCQHPLAREAQLRWQQSQATEALNASARGWQAQAQLSGQSAQQQRSAATDLSVHSAQAQLKLSRVIADAGYQKAWSQMLSEQSSAARLELQAQMQRLVYEAAEAFYVQASLQAQQEAARWALRNAEQSLALVQARRAQGLAIGLEEGQAELQRMQAQTALQQIDGQVAAASAALRTLLSLPLSKEPLTLLGPAPSCSPAQGTGLGTIEDLARVGGVTSVVQMGPLLQQAQHVLREHPGWQASLARQRAAQHGLTAAQLQGRYSVSAMGSLQTTLSQSSTRTTQSQASVGISLDIPLWDSGARQARVGQALAQHDIAQAQQAQLERQLGLSAWQAAVDWQTATQHCILQQQAALVSERSLAQAQARYEAGVGNMLEWTTLQAQHAQSLQRAAQAQVDVQLSSLKLQRSLGLLGPQRLLEEGGLLALPSPSSPKDALSTLPDTSLSRP